MNQIAIDNLEKILNVGTHLTSQREMPLLLDMILSEAMEITNCDAGSLYTLEEKENVLYFEIIRNNTLKSYQGIGRETINLPPVELCESNVSAYSVIHNKMINIDDVYSSEEFDFVGPIEYDKLTGYRTKSMLVVPLENNKGEIVGVVQLINALDTDGNIIPFNKKLEIVLASLASQAGIAVSNMHYIKENDELFHSIVQVLSAAIDERSAYNANHTKNVVEFVNDFVKFINAKYKRGETSHFISNRNIDQLQIAAWLHDIGKIITPLNIMDKATRHGDRTEIVFLRFETIYASEKTRFLQGEISKEEFLRIEEELLFLKKLCEDKNDGKPLTDDEIYKVRIYSKNKTITPLGKELTWFTPEEEANMMIKYGTLTPDERKVMEDHVVITGRLLDKIKFSKRYENVKEFAVGHHEKLNGKGYPQGLNSDEITFEARLLTAMDIFEALIAKDRPYKKPMPVNVAFNILDEMVANNELDGEIVKLIKEWQNSKTEGF